MSGQQSKQNSSGLNLSNMLSTGNSSNQFKQNIYGGQEGALSGLYNNAANLFGTNQQQVQSAIPDAQQYIGNVANQGAGLLSNQGAGGAFRGFSADDLRGQLADTQGPTNMQDINAMIMGGSGNNYADAMKQQYIGDANRAQENMLSNLDARAAASGMSGGSRHGIATALGERDINQNLQRNLAETGFNTFDKDLERKLNIANLADQNVTARNQMNINAMLQALGGKQGAMSGALGSVGDIQNLGMGQFAPLNQVWAGLQNYGNALGGPIVLNQGSGAANNYSQGNSFGTSSSAGKSGGGGI